MIEKKIISSIKKFDLNLRGRVVLTEAATGNYVVTPIIAALAGARTYAYTKNSKYGSAAEARKQTYALAEKMGVRDKITVVTSLDTIELQKIDVLTNTGFLRPINKKLIQKLSSKCVIPLMYEPWEYRKKELDLEACYQHGISVYGTNEEDKRVRTREYIGLTVLKLLSDNKVVPSDNRRILLIGCARFVNPVAKILKRNGYKIRKKKDYHRPPDIKKKDVIVLLEHERDILLIGGKNAFINAKDIGKTTLVIHICGNVSFKNVLFKYIPKYPRPFGYMSFTADYADNEAVINLHTAGLKVAEGMLEAAKMNLTGLKRKKFMELNYPALAFADPRYW